MKSSLIHGVKSIKSGPNEIIWLKLDKNLHIDRDLFDIISEDMSIFQQQFHCKFMVCGDLNGRTGTLPDFVMNDNDAYSPLSHEYEPDVVCLPRNNQDTHVNSQGRRILDLCKMSELRILNGRLSTDRTIGSYTCVTYNGSSLVDYVLSSPSLFNCVDYFCVSDVNEFSDHSIINFTLKVDLHVSSDVNAAPYFKLKWKNDLKDSYIQTLNDELCQSKLF